MAYFHCDSILERAFLYRSNSESSGLPFDLGLTFLDIIIILIINKNLMDKRKLSINPKDVEALPDSMIGYLNKPGGI